jgi:hypothetical protein
MLFDRLNILDDYQRIVSKMYEQNKINELSDIIHNQFIDYKELDAEEQKLLVVICKHLLVFDPKERNIMKFINDPYFIGIRRPIVPFVYPEIKEGDEMYQEGGIDRRSLGIITNWIGELSTEIQLPPVVVANSIDYIIQHAHLYTVKGEYQLFTIVVLWMMENIVSAREFVTYIDTYLYLTDYSYNKAQFFDMLIRVVGDGSFRFDGVYFRLINNNQVCRAILDMIYDLDKYIDFKTPAAYAKHLFKTYGLLHGGPKSNKAVNWEKLHAKMENI